MYLDVYEFIGTNSYAPKPLYSTKDISTSVLGNTSLQTNKKDARLQNPQYSKQRTNNSPTTLMGIMK